MHSGNALILRRLQLRDLQWCRQVYVFDAKFYQVAGSIAAIRAFASICGRRWMKGIRAAKELYQLNGT